MNESEAVEILVKYENIENKPQEYWDALSFLGTLRKDDVWDSDWDNVWEMFEDIKNHVKINGGQLVNADHPLDRKLGWNCKVTGKTWTIKIKDFKKSAENPPEPPLEALGSGALMTTAEAYKDMKTKLLLHTIQTQEGKLRLTEIFNSTK